MLFLIPILHQTTTGALCNAKMNKLFLIPILHQTTTESAIRPVFIAVFKDYTFEKTVSPANRSGMMYYFFNPVSYRV